jgi:hypothetical protein
MGDGNKGEMALAVIFVIRIDNRFHTSPHPSETFVAIWGNKILRNGHKFLVQPDLTILFYGSKYFKLLLLQFKD